MRRKMTAGSTSQMLSIFIQDTTSTTGAGLGSLVFNSAGLVAKYRRAGSAAWTTITLATATVGTFTSGGFIADGGGITGGYEVGIPDAAIAAGVPWVVIQFYGATNMLGVQLEIQLDVVDYQTAQFGGSTTAAIGADEGDTGVSLDKMKEMVAAFMAGKVSVSSAAGISTYTYKKRDGTTTSFTALCSETDGTRATTGALS